MAFIFKKTRDTTNKHSRADITFEVVDDDIALPDLIECVEDFLRAVGYSVDLGSLTVVDLSGSGSGE